MFFALSKIFWMLAMPLNALCILGLMGFGVRFWRKNCGERMITDALIGILFFAFIPVGPLMLHWLERQYSVPETMPDKVDGIIVLGGMFDTHLSQSNDEISANDNIERMFCFAELARKYPNARKVFTGGSGDIEHQDAKEAETALDYFRHSALKADDILYEKDSRNTFENAQFSKELLNPTAHQNWILVTSAYHMPRSVGIFEAQDWKIIPYPCDYRLDGTYEFLWSSPNATRNFVMLNIAVKELIGSIAYYFTGKSAFILPPGPVKSTDE